MEVTKSNFASALPDIKQHIDKCSFLAIDCEFTGLYTTKNDSMYDIPDSYYRKIKDRVHNFLVIQFGLSIFRYDNETKVFKEKSYNFYIFPRRVSKHQAEEHFLCQTSSLEFLIKNKLDFNKVIREGIPYLKQADELILQEQLKKARETKVFPHKIIPADLTEDVDKIMSDIADFRESGEKERVLGTPHGFLRALVRQTAFEKFGKSMVFETRESNNSTAFVVGWLKSQKELDEIDEKICLEAVGFSELIKYISFSRKPVVGHNMMLDLCHTINRFLCKLPEDYEEFKNCATCLLPNLIDTKYIASLPNFKDLIKSTVLGHLLTTVTKPPFVLPPIESENLKSDCYSITDSCAHEAGYDAFITGVCLISLWGELGKLNKYNGDVFENIDYLKSHFNKIFVTGKDDFTFIRIDGPDLQPNRDKVLVICFDTKWEYADVARLFTPFSFKSLSWINDTSAYIALNKFSVQSVLNEPSLKSDSYKMYTFSQYHKISKESSVANKSLEEDLEDVGVPVAISGDGFIPVRNKRSRRNPKPDELGSSSKQRKTVPTILGAGTTATKTFQEDSTWD